MLREKNEGGKKKNSETESNEFVFFWFGGQEEERLTDTDLNKGPELVKKAYWEVGCWSEIIGYYFRTFFHTQKMRLKKL